MVDNAGDPKRPPHPARRGNASAPDPSRGQVTTEGGRLNSTDGGPEDRMMHEGAITTSEPAALPPDMEAEDDSARADRQAVEDVIMETRRREHSAD
jgi:hypothetical protein